MLGNRGHQVRALVHRSPVPGDHVTCIPGSVAAASDCQEVVRGSEIVIQLATTKEDAATFFDVSLRGTFNILEACRFSDTVRQFILLSGDAAQGIWFYPHPRPINEETPLAAYPGYYAFSKVMEETMTRQYEIQYGLRTTILRSSWVFEGDDLLNHFSILKNVNPAEPGHGFGKVPEEVLELVRAGQERIPVLVDGSGNPLTRHIVHIDDVIQALDHISGTSRPLDGTTTSRQLILSNTGRRQTTFPHSSEYLQLISPTRNTTRFPSTSRVRAGRLGTHRKTISAAWWPVNDFQRMVDMHKFHRLSAS